MSVSFLIQKKLFDEKTNDYVLEKFALMRHQETEPVREISRDLQAKNGSGDYVPVAVTISSVLLPSFCCIFIQLIYFIYFHTISFSF